MKIIFLAGFLFIYDSYQILFKPAKIIWNRKTKNFATEELIHLIKIYRKDKRKRKTEKRRKKNRKKTKSNLYDFLLLLLLYVFIIKILIGKIHLFCRFMKYIDFVSGTKH